MLCTGMLHYSGIKTQHANVVKLVKLFILFYVVVFLLPLMLVIRMLYTDLLMLQHVSGRCCLMREVDSVQLL